jgi:serine/threonine-protein kinase
MHQILNLAPVPPSVQLASLGNGYDQVVERAIAKARKDRYPTARAFLEALMAVEDTIGPTADAPHAGQAMPEDDDNTIVIDTPAAALDTSPGSIDTQWKIQVLPDVEKLLSYQIGPIAKVLAKKSLAQASSLDDFCILLMPHIPSQAGQEQFQQAVRLLIDKPAASAARDGTGSSRSTDASRGREPYIDFGTNPPDSAPPETYDDAWAEAIGQQLTLLVGPIARIMVKRAARQTRKRSEFLELLAEHIESGPDRARFLIDASCCQTVPFSLPAQP